jgi:signal transduction histidine kinase/CheY-like chemotaxis protein
MRLRWAMAMSFVLVLGVMVALLYGAARVILVRGYLEVERRETERNVRRAQSALQRVVDGLSVKASDWGAWDDTYKFVEDRNEAYIASNLTPESLANLQVDGILFFDADDRLVLGRAVHDDQLADLDASLVDALRSSGLLRHEGPESSPRGVIRRDDGLVLAASRPITTSANEGPVRGSVVFFRRLGDEVVRELSALTELEMSVCPLDGATPPDFLEAAAALGNGGALVRPQSPTLVSGYGEVREMGGALAAVVRVRTAREVYGQGLVSLRWVMVSIIGAGAAVALALMLLLDRMVISRLERMSGQVERIGSGRDATPVVEGGVRELGALAGNINRMVGTITAASDQLATRAEELRVKTLQLEQSRLQAEAANRAKTEFLAHMSHEIRTPMTSVLGYAEMLLEPGLDPAERDQYVRRVHRAGTSLLTIINDILDISKVEAGHLTIERVSMSPGAVVGETLALLRGRAEEKGLALSAWCTSPIPLTIISDPTRLRQILVNIVGNAIKFTEHGEVCVGVGLRRRDTGRDELIFEVRDSGQGMTPEQLERLFRPFTQADSSTTRRHGGTGLGLYISKRFAEALGGTIRVTSTPGVGTTFTVSVHPGPLDGAWWTEQLGEEPAPATVATVPSLQLQGRVLLAEDSADNQRLISHILRKAGLEVEIAENGVAVLDRVRAASDGGAPTPDLVLLDMNMPVMDGYETIRRLRSAGCPLPVVALTAMALSGERARCIEAGCDDYATKPIQRAALLRLCATWIEQGRARRDDPSRRRVA